VVLFFWFLDIVGNVNNTRNFVLSWLLEGLLQSKQDFQDFLTTSRTPLDKVFVIIQTVQLG
jgi:hypothetical protein